ncbi:MAG: DNA mismatch repair protein MutS [Myxococcota bacterium]|nr:DNA mismatch repair protein MutS [Myxococcota bacterium]
MSEPSRSPRVEIERRLAARRAVLAAADVRARSLSHARLAVFAGAALVALLGFGGGWLDPRWTLLPALGFVGLVIAHDRVLRRRDEAARAVRCYEDALARLDGDFSGRGPTGERFRDPEHAYADDLDLFGTGSLFDLLCRARTAAGEAMLAQWLLAPAAPEEVRERQAAVAELAVDLDLRESLVLVGDAVAAGLHADALLRWGESAPPAPAPALRVAAAALAALSAALLLATFLGVPALIPWLGVLLVSGIFAAGLRSRVRRSVRETEAPARDLALLARLLGLLEGATLTSPRAAALRAAIALEGVPASRRIQRLGRLVELLDARRNQLFAPIGATLLFTTQIALAIDVWRARFGPRLRIWLAAVAEIEALASLGTHAYEHPDDVFPRFETGAPAFRAEALGHPLLREDRCVRNDVSLGDAPRILLISGSNMSGKSTLLRSVGVAAVLAQAGAPVRARTLVLSPLSVGASLRIFDSLQAGHSHFYAEIRRLRAVVGLTEDTLPVLFLLDEILHGTNSHDRRIGAEAVIRTLERRGAIGLVTTHDLALARIAEELAPRAANVHFEDQIVDGRMSFDYRMRPGVVTRSNALELMRAVGLEV